MFALVAAWSGAPLIGTLAAFNASPLMGVAYVANESDSWDVLQAQGHRLTTVITTSFYIADTAGTLGGRPEPRVVELAHQLGMKVHFRVANYIGGRLRRDVAHAVLAYPATRAGAIAGILRVLDAHDYDGVNIDLEGVAPSQRAALTAFVGEVGTEVHRRGKTLSIAVPGKTVDDLQHAWTAAFDLAALGQVCDFVIIMAYDQHSSASGAGPVAALPWVEAVTEFATSQVEREKILLGLAFYGYTWPRRGYGIPISMRRAIGKAADTGVPVLWDEQNGVPYYRAGSRTVYFENARSIQLKLDLAMREQLAGVSMWRLGLEDPDLWEVLGRYVDRSRTVLPAGVLDSSALLDWLQNQPIANE